MWLRLTEFVQNRDESAPCLQVLSPQSIQRDEEQRLLRKAVTEGGKNLIGKRKLYLIHTVADTG